MKRSLAAIAATIFLLILCFSLGACSTKKQDLDMARSFGSYSISGEKCVYIKNELVYVQDIATNQSTILCTKPNCKHEPYSPDDNPNPQCEAASRPGSSMILSVALCGQTVYEWVNSSNANESVLYRMNLESHGWQKVGSIPYQVDSSCNSFYKEDTAYLACLTETIESEKDINEVKQRAVIVKVNLKNAKSTEISDAYTAMYHARMNALQYSDGVLCYETLLLKDGYQMNDIEQMDNSIFDAKIGVIDLAKQKCEEIDNLQLTKYDDFIGYFKGRLYVRKESALVSVNIDGTDQKGIKEITQADRFRFFDGQGIWWNTEDGNRSFYSFGKEKWINIEIVSSSNVPEQYRVTDEPVAMTSQYVWINQSEMADENTAYMRSDWIPFSDYSSGVRTPHQEDAGAVTEEVRVETTDSNTAAQTEPDLNDEYYETHWEGKTILNWWSAHEIKPHVIAACNDMLAEKNRPYVIRVTKVEDYENEYRQNLMEAKKSKAPVDLIAIGTQLIGEKQENKYEKAVKAGLLSPLTTFLHSQKGNEFFQMYTKTQWDGLTIDGEIYSYDWRTMPVQDLCLLVNKDYLDKYHYTVNEETTLEEIFQMADELAKKEDSKRFYPIYWSVDETEQSVQQRNIKGLDKLREQYRGVFKLHDGNSEDFTADDFHYFAKFVEETLADVSDTQSNDSLPYAHKTNIVKLTIKQQEYIPITNGLTGVASWSEHKDMAEDFLNLVNTDADMATIFQFGEEGVDYELKNGRIVRTTEDSSVYYSIGNKWITPPYELEPDNKLYEYRNYIESRIQ